MGIINGVREVSPKIRAQMPAKFLISAVNWKEFVSRSVFTFHFFFLFIYLFNGKYFIILINKLIQEYI